MVQWTPSCGCGDNLGVPTRPQVTPTNSPADRDSSGARRSDDDHEKEEEEKSVK